MNGTIIGLLILSGVLILAGVAVLVFAKSSRIVREARKQNAPREWLLVDAYSSLQARPGFPQTYGEALAFLKEHVGGPFVRADMDNAIIFFDGRKIAR